MKKAIIVSVLLCFLFCFSFAMAAEEKNGKNDHELAKKMIEWPPDKVFFQIIELSDDALDCIKIKLSNYRIFLIEECANKSAKSKITEREFEEYKIKISKCSDTENLLIFILNLRKYQGNKGELVFEGSIF